MSKNMKIKKALEKSNVQNHFRFENKEIKDLPGITNYCTLAAVCLYNTSGKDISTGVMRERFKTIDMFEGKDTATHVMLEPMHLKTLQACMSEVKWRIIHRDIVKFEDYVNELVENIEK